MSFPSKQFDITLIFEIVGALYSSKLFFSKLSSFENSEDTGKLASDKLEHRGF